MRAKLTKSLIDSILPDPKADLLVWDLVLANFGLRISKGGTKSFVLYYRDAAGHSHRVTIGRYGLFAVEKARARAAELLRDIRAGSDPVEEKRVAKEEAAAALTLREFSERYLSDYAAARKKPRSVANDKWLFERVILPALGEKKIGELAREDVARFHAGLKAKPYLANRTLALLSTLCNFAIEQGFRPEAAGNPCARVRRYKEKARECSLTPAQLSRLWQTLDEAEANWNTLHAGTDSQPIPENNDDSAPLAAMPATCAAIRLLIATGARCGEILGLRWNQVDIEKGIATLGDSKTGPKVLYLNSLATGILAALPRHPSGWVIPGWVSGRPMVNITKPWVRIRAAAGMPALRLHDLRHAHATLGASLKIGLPVLAKVMGHARIQTTMKYVNLDHDPAKMAAEEIGEAIQAALDGKIQSIQPPAESAAAVGAGSAENS